MSALVQSKTAASSALVTSFSITLDATPTAGNIIIMAVGLQTGTFTLPQSAGITWCYTEANPNATTYSALCYGRVNSGASATITITCGTSSVAISAAEFSGTNLIPDQAVKNTGGSSSPSTGSTATTTNANELWIAAFASTNVTYSAPTNSYSIIGQAVSTIGTSNDRSACLAYRIVTSTGAASAGVTASSSVNWAAQGMTFYEAGAGSTGKTLKAVIGGEASFQ